MITGSIQVQEQQGMHSMPQKAASAWSAFETSGIVGAGYKPIAYVGTQITKGVNHWFIAQQTVVYSEPERHIVKMAINEWNGEFKLVPHSIEIIF